MKNTILSVAFLFILSTSSAQHKCIVTEKSNLMNVVFSAPDHSSTELGKIQFGDTVKILESKHPYWKISFEDSVGYIRKSIVKVPDQISFQFRDKERKGIEDKRLAELTAKYGNKYAALMINNDVEIGMTTEMVEDSMGNPERKSVTIIENLRIEYYHYSYAVLRFENGILKVISY